jgi:tyrosine-protein kinase Etk/Wzc
VEDIPHKRHNEKGIMEERTFFKEIFNIVLIKWHIIAASVIVFALVGLLYSFLKPPVYTAFTIVQVEEPINRRTFLEDLFLYGRPSRVDTEMEIIKSRSIAERVAKISMLDVNVKEIKGNLGFKIKKLQVDKKFLGVPIKLVVKNNCTEYSAFANGTRLSNEEFLIEFVYCKGEGEALVYKNSFEDVVNKIKNGIKTEKIGEATNLIKVSFSWTDPVKSAEIANMISEVYIEFNKEKWTEDLSQTMDFISSQLDKVKDQLKEAEEKMDAFRKTHGIAEISKEAEGIIEKLSELEKEKTAIEIELFQVRRAIQDIDREPSKILSSSFGDPVLQSLVSKLAELDIKRYSLLQRFTENHPEVVEVSAEREELIEKIKEILKEKEKALTSRKKGIEEFIDKYEGEIKNYPEVERNLLRLARNLKVNEDIYTFLLTKYEEVRIAKAASVGNIKIIDRAIPPSSPVFPNKKKILLFSVFSGFLFGFMISFLIYYFSDTINSPEEIETSYKIPVFGVLPEVRNNRNSNEIEINVERYLKEAGRILKTTLFYSPLSENLKTFIITSPLPKEGKTTVLRLLGDVISEGTEDVLIIDGDFKKRDLSKIMNLEKNQGFIDVLAGLSVEEGIYELKKNLKIMPAGTHNSFTTSLLESKKPAEIISQLKNSYSYIFIDTPPLLSVVDTLILSKIVDGVLLVITPYQTSRSHLTKAIKLLKNVKVNLLGCIMNKVPTRGTRYYYYYLYPEERKETIWKKIRRRKKDEV